jgi:hypothetical protein
MEERLEAVDGNCVVLEQALEVLRRMDDATYAQAGAAPGISAVGVHFRHVLDHYRAFFAGLPFTEIDYDARDRRVPLERDRTLAIAAVMDYLRDLDRLSAGLGEREVRVNLRSLAGQDGAADWSRSTVKRELQFLVSHTVHHYALIKELLRGAGFDAGKEFGVAPSTLAAQRRDAACAR